MNERHRHRYEVNKTYVPQLEEAGLKFVGTDEDEARMEIVELDNHPYYVAVQFHPEYLSRPLKPSPPFMGLILASLGKLKGYLNKGLRLSPRQMNGSSSGMRRLHAFPSKLYTRNQQSKLSNKNLILISESEEDVTTVSTPQVNGNGLNGHAKGVNGINGISSSTEESDNK